MRKANEIVICRDEYDNQHDFEEMVKNAVMLLLNNDYIATIKYDEKGLGIVAIEYDYDDASYGSYYPYWLLPEEFEQIEFED